MKINLMRECLAPSCQVIADDEYKLLNVPKYSKGVAAVRIDDFAEWLASHRTARKRALRSERLGYHVETFEPSEYYEDLLEINRSKERRQGRPMTDSYWNLKPTGLIGPSACTFHHRLEYGVFGLKKLRGYAGMIRCGELLHVSMFLGHWDYLEAGIMYFLMREILRQELEAGPVALYYNRYDSGTDGLRFYKNRIGFEEMDVKWSL